MRCEKFRDLYDMLDSGEEPNFFLQLHLASCPRCSAELERAGKALEAYRSEEGPSGLSPGADSGADLGADLGEAIDEKVMNAVRLLPKPKRELHARDWLVAGLVILASMALIPYDHNFALIKEAFGASYSLPLSLALGVVFTLYAAVFIATHMEELEPFVRRHLHRA